MFDTLWLLTKYKMTYSMNNYTEAKEYVEEVQSRGFFLIITGFDENTQNYLFTLVDSPSQYTYEQVERIIKLKAFL